VTAKATVIEVRGLTKAFGIKPVLRKMDFYVEAGEFVALLGPNGAGKSTLCKAIAGLLPYQGRAAVGEQDLADLEPRARARLVTYVPQHSALEAPLPVRDVVEQGRFATQGDLPWRRASQSDVAESRAAVADALVRTDILHLADRPFDTLSYGERRRVLVARALATRAPVLLLDEPTAALDVAHALALLQVLADVARAPQAPTAVVLVLHQLQEAASVADHAVLLAEGRCRLSGPATEVIAPGPVAEVYGVKMLADAQFACTLLQAPRSW